VSRAYCELCHYPQSACVCASVQPMSCQTQVIVMQHPSEVGHSKNTVHLLSLVLPAMRRYVGESAADFEELRQKLHLQPCYLVYPSDQSQSADQISIALANTNNDSVTCEFTKENPASGAAPTARQTQASVSIILLDGTWRKAYRMLQLNPWLRALPSLHLNFDGQSQYKIRKSSRTDSLSTLEAAAYTIQALEPNLDIEPILKLFDAMVQARLDAMPAKVRARYHDK
jgi:DTW domain-containing protein YfiP